MAASLCKRCAHNIPVASRGCSNVLFRSNARCLHRSALRAAQPLPVVGSGPPPAAPEPPTTPARERLERQRKNAELLKRGQELRQKVQPASAPSKPASGLLKRFWKDVSVKRQDDGSHTIHLDQRPVRTPITKSVLPIPPSKPHLATAIALEWDNLTTAQQALKGHHIPLTSMTSRAIDIEMQDDALRKSGSAALSPAREDVVKIMLRYLDTDTLLCWAPERPVYDAGADAEAPGAENARQKKESLRQQQVRTAEEILGHLTAKVWPGVSVNPVLDGDSIIPAPQPQETRDVIRGWLAGLPAWELAGLERAVLASKSLCVGTRLLIDWAEAFRDINKDLAGNGQKKFGIEDAAKACTLEVTWQTAMWGEVEDTHDVDKEDLRRQLGSVILVVGGTS